MSRDVDHQITQILNAIPADVRQHRTALFSVMYDDLQNIARGQMRREAAGHTLQATALVHETFLKLMQLKECQWANRRHFFSAAAEVMRRILIDHARRRSRQKRGGAMKRVDLDNDQALAATETRDAEFSDDLLELDEALEEFERLSPQKAQLVKLRFFSGLTNRQAAELLEISESTAERYWAFARAWLYSHMDAKG